MATTPTMMPAAAQVAATFSICREPSFSASDAALRDAHRRVAAQEATRAKRRRTVAQNTDSIGEKPSSMKTTIETSDRKWNQYRLRERAKPTRRARTRRSRMPNLRASISTIRNSDR